MQFEATEIPGVVVVELERIEDERGFFARSWCEVEFAQQGLDPDLSQCNISFNRERHTLRGMHLQVAPHEEAKLVRVTRGALFDVALDLRPDSATYCRWTGHRLDAQNRRMLYIPEGVAHGFVTLEDETEVFYQMSHTYAPDAARGVRYDDPAFAIEWPGSDYRISPRDLEHPVFDPAVGAVGPEGADRAAIDSP